MQPIQRVPETSYTVHTYCQPLASLVTVILYLVLYLATVDVEYLTENVSKHNIP